MKYLRLAKGLNLPVDGVTETYAIIGRRGSGKSHTASVLVEELVGADQQCVVFDPLDSLWGFRSSADGKSAGLSIAIFGGSHADLPLTETAGALLADVVVEDRISCVFSLRHLSKNALRRFAADFCERLYERKGHQDYRDPLHVVFDEADVLVPQRIMPGGERAFGAVDTLVRRGRSSGIGTTLISQRPAVISKDVLTQTEVLICHQTTGPQDRKALEAWIEAHDTADRGEQFLESLAALKKGEAWVWSPAWLDVFQRVRVRERLTFDSSATPKVGSKQRAPTKIAEVDLDALRARIDETVQKAKENDPRELKKRIAELEKSLKVSAPGPAKIERVEVPVFDEKVIEDLRQLLAKHMGYIEMSTREGHAKIDRAILEYVERCRTRTAAMPRTVGKHAIRGPVERARELPLKPYERAERRARAERSNGAAASGLGKCARAILTAILQRDPKPSTDSQVSILSGYSLRSSTFHNGVSELRVGGLVEGDRHALRATEAGRAVLPDVPPLPESAELVAYWQSKLGKCESALLAALVEAYPAALSREELSQRSGYSLDSSTFHNGVSALRTLELLRGRVDDLRASEDLCT